MRASEWFCRRGHRVTSAFGPRPDPFGSGKTTFHAGIDISGKVGDPIETPTQGTVTHAKKYSGYGNLVAVQDPRGCRHLFAHLDRISVKTGQKVVRGDLVGTKGRTGDVTGPHLHYQINKPEGVIRGDGYWGDPDKYVFVEDERTVDKLILYNSHDDEWASREIERRVKAPRIMRGNASQELIDLVDQLYVVGGPEIKAPGKVIYLSGADRYETAQAVIDFLKK